MLDKNFWGTLLIGRNTISKGPLETLMKPRVKLSRWWLVYSLFSNRLFKFSFPLHSPILKPYFNLCFCKFQVGCYFNSSCPCKIFAKVELLLQFNQLSLCEGEPLLLTCCRFLLLVRACFLFFRDTCYCSFSFRKHPSKISSLPTFLLHVLLPWAVSGRGWYLWGGKWGRWRDRQLSTSHWYWYGSQWMRKRNEALRRSVKGTSTVCYCRRMSKWHRTSKIKPVVMRHGGRQVWSRHPTAPVVHHIVDFLPYVPTAAASLGWNWWIWKWTVMSKTYRLGRALLFVVKLWINRISDRD